MTRFLPPGMWCTAFWYAERAGLLTGDDLEFLRDLGARAARLARWYGYPEWIVPEGPYQVHMWPEHVWDEVANAMANEAARYGHWDSGTYQ